MSTRVRCLRRSIRSGVAALAALTLATACYAWSSPPVTGIRPAAHVRLDAPEGFVVNAEPGALVSDPCVATRLRGTLTGRSGDTLVLARVRNLVPVGERVECALGADATVVVSATPGLSVRTLRFSPGRTIYAVVLSVPLYIALVGFFTYTRVP